MMFRRSLNEVGTAPDGAQVRTLIYGSCVSRDSFEYLGEPYRLTKYVARQSLISAMAPASPLPEGVGEYSSAFQRRMAHGDAGSDLLVHLKRLHKEIDLLLWDLTDERLGVYIDKDGRTLTRTVEMIRSGAEDTVSAGARHIAFGSDEHFALWCDAMSAFASRLASLDLLRKVLLLDVAWASRTERCHRTPSSFGISPSTANAMSRRYVRCAQSAGVQVVRLSGLRVHAADMHQWGPAPFHYSVTTSRTIARRIRRGYSRLT